MMEQVIKLRLLSDIYSGHKEIYGKKNEQVTLLADHDNVLIVQGKTGTFPVPTDQTAPTIITA